MKVKYIRPARSSGYLTVGIDDNGTVLSFTVSEADYVEAGSLLTADEVSSRSFLILKASDEAYRASLYALRILSYADNNEKSLVRKLVGRGISYDVAVRTAEKMVGMGYINEEEQLRRIVQREANVSLSGPKKIRIKLISRGYSAKDIDAAIAALVKDGEVDFTRSAQLLVAKKLTRGATDDEVKKLLYKNGYNIC